MKFNRSRWLMTLSVSLFFISSEKLWSLPALEEIWKSPHAESPVGDSLSATKDQNRLRQTQIVLSSWPEGIPFYSQPITLIATVVPSRLPGPTPTGTVRLEMDNTFLSTQTLINGRARLKLPVISTTERDQHDVLAVYSGDGVYEESKELLNLSILRANTALILALKPNPSEWGSAVTLRAKVSAVSPAVAIPDGSIEFYADGLSLSTGSLDAKGQATFSTSELSIGTHTITAIYGSSGNFHASKAEVIQHVEKGNTTIGLKSSNSSSSFGEAVVLTIEVSSKSGTPTGSVELVINGINELFPLFLDESGKVTSTLENLRVGYNHIVAYYSGDLHFNPSDRAFSQKVKRAKTHLKLTSLEDPFHRDDLLQVIVEVTARELKPNGFVQFKMNGKNLYEPQILSSQGQAMIKIRSLKGVFPLIEADYLGSEDFSPSNGVLTRKVKEKENEE